jgi:hypothetical protein
LLLGFGGIFCTSATEPGQLMTRLAVEPPTILLCCIFCLHGNGFWQIPAVAGIAHKLYVRHDLVFDVIQDDALDLGAGEFNFHFTVL